MAYPSNVRIIESNDDVEVNEVMPPETFLRDNFQWVDFKDLGIDAADLPRPLTWRLMVLPKQPRKMTTGGIALPDQVNDVERHLNYIGQVVAMGPLAGKNEKFENPKWMPPQNTVEAAQRLLDIKNDIARFGEELPREPRYLWDVKIGDWIIYGKYSGQHIEFRGTRFLTINDDEVVQVIKSPEGYRVYL